MNKDQVKGKLDDAAGRVKRQVGEWTGDTKAQVEGAAQQVKGKAENAWGKMKDAARDAEDEAEKSHDDEQSKRPYGSDEEAPRKQERDKDRNVA